MSKQVRISEEVYELIQSDAIPLEDSVDSVLRKWAQKLGKLRDSSVEPNKEEGKVMSATQIQNRKYSGKKLNELWKVGAKHALYHKDGTWYNNLTKFPGALFDPNGYLLFETQKDFLGCKLIRVGSETNCESPISKIPGYVRMR